MKQFLIYKGEGGLSHLIHGLAYAFDFAEANDYSLIIDTTTESFGIDFFEFFEIKNSNILVTSNYNILPQKLKLSNYNNISVRNIRNNSVKYITTNNYHINNINISKKLNKKNKMLVYCGHGFCKKNSNKLFYKLFVKKNIILRISRKFNLKFKYISVHFRNTDIKNDKYIYLSKLKKLLTSKKIKYIYISTDDCNFLKFIKSELRNFNIFYSNEIPNFNGKNIHYNSKNKFDQIYNCLTDMYYILKSDYFIPSLNSGLSKWLIEIISSKSLKSNNIFNLKSNAEIIR